MKVEHYICHRTQIAKDQFAASKRVWSIYRRDSARFPTSKHSKLARNGKMANDIKQWLFIPESTYGRERVNAPHE